MTTGKKTDANRCNALQSTGPRTAEGKTIVARNAVKHGLLSREVVLDVEHKAAFRAMAVALWEDLQPVGAVEGLLADRIIASAWRLRRVHVIENELCDDERYEGLGIPFIRDCHGAEAFQKLARYEAAIERGLYRALHELERLQTRRSGGYVPPPVTVDVTVDAGGQAGNGV